MVEKLNELKEKVNLKTVGLASAGGVGTALLACCPVFAEGEIATFTITSSMLSPVTSAINSGLTTLVPIGLTVMASMIGISLIPRIIYKFL